MRFWIIIGIIFIVGFFGWGVYGLLREKNTLSEEAGNLATVRENLLEENMALIERVEYLENSENLLKEVKSRFNYREAGEGLIIIVPGETTSSQQ